MKLGSLLAAVVEPDPTRGELVVLPNRSGRLSCRGGAHVEKFEVSVLKKGAVTL